MERALALLAKPDGFIVWLENHRNAKQGNTILGFLVDYLKACGIQDVRIWIKTWPCMQVGEEMTDITIYWIVNLQQYFGQRLTHSVSGEEVLAAIVANPTTYSLIKQPPE